MNEMVKCTMCGGDMEPNSIGEHYSWGDCVDELKRQLSTVTAERDRAIQDAEHKGDLLQEIENWCHAYPLDIFPEPDFKKVRELLEAGGITLDSVSASNMRHVLKGVAEIVQRKESTNARP